MKYICWGYMEPGNLARNDRGAATGNADDHRRATGYLAAGEPLPPPETTLTLSWKRSRPPTVPTLPAPRG
jgi:hypothetical protein